MADSGKTTRRLVTYTRVTGKTIIVLTSIAVFAACGFAYVTYSTLQNRLNTTNISEPEPDSPPIPPESKEATDILLVGTDSRTDMQGNPLPLDMLKTLRTEGKEGVNTDTIILLRIPKKSGKPVGISIPRDTWITPAQGQSTKINAVFGAAKNIKADALRRKGESDNAKIERDSDDAGRRALTTAVSGLTGVKIDHYAEVSLLGFYLLTEALGGVQVCLNQATEDKDSGADFKAGVQTVSGGEALSFVRQRKNLPRGDLDRIVRQQVFLSSAMQQILSAGTLTNSTKLNQLIEAAQKSILLDNNLNMFEFVQQIKSVSSGELEFLTIPVINISGRSPDGQSIVEIDPEAVRNYVHTILDPMESSQTSASNAPAGGGRSVNKQSLILPQPRMPASTLLQTNVPCVN